MEAKSHMARREIIGWRFLFTLPARTSHVIITYNLIVVLKTLVIITRSVLYLSDREICLGRSVIESTMRQRSIETQRGAMKLI